MKNINAEELFDYTDLWLNSITARAQYLSDRLSKNSPELFSWRSKFIKAHLVNPETGAFDPDLVLFKNLDEGQQFNILVPLLVSADAFEFHDTVKLAKEAVQWSLKLNKDSLPVLREEALKNFSQAAVEENTKIRILCRFFVENTRAHLEKNSELFKLFELIDISSEEKRQTKNKTNPSARAETSVNSYDVKNTGNGDLFLNTDGASRGNPGRASVAFVLQDENKNIIKEHGRRIGTATNNYAEYLAVREGLEFIANIYLKEKKEVEHKNLTLRSDSELLVKQLNGQYRVKNSDLIPLHASIKTLIHKIKIDFGLKVRVEHVRRELNKRADALCNKALNATNKK